MTSAANFALDGGDPRGANHGQGIANVSSTELRKLHDPSVTFEEYLYYAERAREGEKNMVDEKTSWNAIAGFGRKKEPIMDVAAPVTANEQGSADASANEKEKDIAVPRNDSHDAGIVTDEEWYHAARAARTATWGAVFYLITTDVLGPYTVPWAMSQMGYGPGITLYTVFGALAGYTGWQIWQMFLKLDSERWPMKTYGDIAFRIYGPYARYGVNILQSIQLLCNVGVIVIQNGQGLYEINPNICFIVCCVIWAASGFLLGQVRTLQRFGWIANSAIWINVICLILTMAVVPHSAPNYDASAASNGRPGPDEQPGPVHVYGGAPPYSEGFMTGVSGLMQAVYSYGGAMLFCEFMSEMRKPADFWKAFICAEAFIYVVYLFFGLFVYSYQGEYTINPANQGMSPRGPLIAGNILNFIAALIAAALYGNIGIKVLYQNVLIELFKAPELTARSGKILWIGLVPIYWTVAFVLAAAIPNFSYLTGLVAALCILQFTYTFPPLLMLGFRIKYNAIRPGEGYDPATGRTTRLDNGWKRWLRGAKKNWYWNLWDLVFCLGALVTAGLGAYSSIEGIITAFSAGRNTSFSCQGPI